MHDITATALGHQNNRLVIGGGNLDTVIQFWDIQFERQLATFRVPTGVKALEFAPDDKQLIVTLNDNTVQIWDSRESDVRQLDCDARRADFDAERQWASAMSKDY